MEGVSGTGEGPLAGEKGPRVPGYATADGAGRPT